jgi:HlyD family secretion protein
VIPEASSMDRQVAGRHASSIRLALGGVVGAILLLGLGWPMWQRWSSVDRAVDASRLQIAQVRRGELVRDAAADGRIVAANAPTLFAASSGIVTLHVRAGDPVQAGQVLASIESPELLSTLAQERASLLSLEAALGRARITARQTDVRNQRAIELAEVRLQAAERNLERARQTFEQGLLNKVDYERAADDVAIAQLELRQAREALTLERETADFEIRTQAAAVAGQQSLADEVARQVARLDLVAPFAGLVGTVAVRDRDAVAANQPVLTVVNLDAYEIAFSLPENYVSDTGIGTPVRIVYEGREFSGRVTAISPSVTDSQVQGRAVFEGEPPSSLRENQRVSLRLLFETRPDVLVLPRGAFLESGGGRLAYVVQDGVATRRPIETGARSLSHVEVVSGLREGDEVIVSDTSDFTNAERLRLRGR